MSKKRVCIDFVGYTGEHGGDALAIGGRCDSDRGKETVVLT